MIRVTDLYKTYQMGEVFVHALNGVSLEIGKGEFVGIAGASGSGKSTLLHMIGLLDVPTSGSVEISETDVFKLPDYEKTLFRLEWLGFVFQDYALSSELTAYENVILPLMARGVSDADMEERALHMLDQVGLLDRALHLPKELSGGEQQRVAIARGLVNEPAILLADEPCGNLDTKNSTIILDLIAEINRESRQTVLMISHEDDHQQYCERVITLSDGEIVEG
ncbi:MAG: ABC transporter ATP-binding protein [Methanocalculus sp. MSAO_Arc1]|uniref:ABC transporter ATP-binding protein n=1 Tax=Methanocalculus TaxID=71151 RepID=UPI000FF3D339|nr:MULTISPECIES: ABC transporter ATP-binding protein [unclassified Methanocalculus]MCP1662707.1 putative ABC transport system ATP-binding protein [Methanocalculus sp. AMF5]RQD79980.1 MAG: ABC transporter ATP-binding protein [Methanocalculus sp. MSAO_Arc1]